MAYPSKPYEDLSVSKLKERLEELRRRRAEEGDFARLKRSSGKKVPTTSMKMMKEEFKKWLETRHPSSDGD